MGLLGKESVSRWLTAKYQADQLLANSRGAHHCPGAPPSLKMGQLFSPVHDNNNKGGG